MFNNIAIIGSGVISAILNLMFYLLNKNNKLLIFDINKNVSNENSKAINNAGTGHSGMCENNYIKVNHNNYYIKKNIRIYCKFNLTKNFFSWINFINLFNINKIIIKTPHLSFFFLKKTLN